MNIRIIQSMLSRILLGAGAVLLLSSFCPCITEGRCFPSSSLPCCPFFFTFFSAEEIYLPM